VGLKNFPGFWGGGILPASGAEEFPRLLGVRNFPGFWNYSGNVLLGSPDASFRGVAGVSDRVLPQGSRGGTALPGVRELPQEDRHVIWFPGVSSGRSPGYRAPVCILLLRELRDFPEFSPLLLGLREFPGLSWDGGILRSYPECQPMRIFHSSPGA
jgi:hypothetical protein